MSHFHKWNRSATTTQRNGSRIGARGLCAPLFKAIFVNRSHNPPYPDMYVCGMGAVDNVTKTIGQG